MATNKDKIAEFFKKRHPSYTKYKSDWNKMWLAYHGGSAFTDAFLLQYEKEPTKFFKERKRRSAYENILADCIDRRSDIIFSRNIKRDPKAGNKVNIWKEINENIDQDGTARGDFIQRVCFPLSQIFGWVPVLVDKPEGAAYTGQGQQDQKLWPYAVPILPLNFLNWRMGDDGQLEWALLRFDTRRLGEPMAEEKQVREYRLIDRVKTEVWEERRESDGQGETTVDYVRLRTAPHNLGSVPVVVLYDKQMLGQKFIGAPSLLSSTDLSILMFNMMNWSGEVAYKTLYNTLVAPESHGTDEREKAMGPGEVLFFPEGSVAPHWISAPTDPIAEYRNEIKDMRRRAYKQAKLDEGQAEEHKDEMSGIAKTIDRKPTEDMAKRRGQNLETFEVQLDLMMMQVWEEDATFESGVQYPKRYAVQTTRYALEQQELVEKSTTLPPKVKALLASKIVNTEDLAELDEDEQAELEEKILNYDPQAEEVEQARKLKRAEVEELIPLEEKRIAVSKQHSEVMAQKNLEAAKIHAEVEREKMKLDAENRKAEAAKPKEEPKTRGKLGALLGS